MLTHRTLGQNKWRRWICCCRNDRIRLLCLKCLPNFPFIPHTSAEAPPNKLRDAQSRTYNLFMYPTYNWVGFSLTCTFITQCHPVLSCIIAVYIWVYLSLWRRENYCVSNFHILTTQPKTNKNNTLYRRPNNICLLTKAGVNEKQPYWIRHFLLGSNCRGYC